MPPHFSHKRMYTCIFNHSLTLTYDPVISSASGNLVDSGWPITTYEFVQHYSKESCSRFVEVIALEMPIYMHYRFCEFQMLTFIWRDFPR